MCVHMHTCAPTLMSVVLMGPEVLDPLELELQAVLTWELRTQVGSSASIVHTLNNQAVSIIPSKLVLLLPWGCFPTAQEVRRNRKREAFLEWPERTIEGSHTPGTPDS